METQDTIHAWAEETFPGPADDPEAGIRAQALKLVGEAVEVALACGVKPWVIYEAMADKFRKLPTPVSEGDLSSVPGEIADVAIVLSVLAGRVGCRIDDEVDAKMGRNRARKWNVSKDGSAQHIQEA